MTTAHFSRFFFFSASVLFFFSCANSPKNIPFPVNSVSSGAQYVKLDSLIPVDLHPHTITGDSIKQPEEKKFAPTGKLRLQDFESNCPAPDTIMMQPADEKILQGNDVKKFPPKIIAAGMPVSVISQPPSVRDNILTNIRFYSNDHGLTGNLGQCLLLDHAGRLWVGTDGGLSMFDGHTWEQYSTAQGLSSNQVNSLYEDEQHRLWIGTNGGGLDMLDEEGKTFSHWDTKNGLTNNAVYGLAEDDQKNIWAGTYGGGIDVISLPDNSIVHFGKVQGLSGNNVWCMKRDHRGHIWAGMHGSGVNIINPQNHAVKIISAAQGLTSASVFSLAEDRAGRMWMGTNGGGILIVTPSSSTLLHYASPSPLITQDVFSLLCDKDGNMWAGTFRSGTTMISSDGKKVSHFMMAQGMSNDAVMSLLGDDNGNIWMGTNGGGVDVMQKQSGTFKFFSKNEGICDNYVFAVRQDEKGKIWMGTNGGGIDVLDPANDSMTWINAGLSFTVITDIAEGRDGNFWVATYGYGVNRIDPAKGTVRVYTEQQGISHRQVSCLFADREGNTWIGTPGYGLDRINVTGDTVLHFSTANGLSNNFITTVTEDKRGYYWVGTNGGGVNVIDPSLKKNLRIGTAVGLGSDLISTIFFDRDGNRWIGTDGNGLYVILGGDTMLHYTTANGLPNDRIQSFLEDDNGKIWTGTAKGLACFSPITGKRKFPAFRISTMGKAEGFRATDFGENAALLSKNGTFYWGTGEILTAFTPAKLLDTVPPRTYITAVNVMQQNFAWQLQSPDSGYCGNHNLRFSGAAGTYHLPVQLEVPFSQGHFTFSFAGIAFGQENEIRYRYILDGLDEKWSEGTADNKADYRNLPPGKYIFKVSACNRSGVWSKPAEFSFEVDAPWWRNAGAYTGYVIGFFSILFGFNGVRTENLRKRQKQLEITVKQRTAEIAEKQKEIIDSINYAAKIQQAILPPYEKLQELFPSSFIFFRPRDIVSGDFYWFTEKAGTKIIAAVDCTGHGVPGAFMSMIGNAFLNEIVNERGITKPSEILGELRRLVIQSLKQKGASGEQRDGMDISLLSFTSSGDTVKVEWAGAHNPLWLVRGKEKMEWDPDRRPIGFYKGQGLPFTNHTVQVQKGDMLFIFTDGYADQFGGPKGKKFKYRQYGEMLSAISNKAPSEQKMILEKTFDEWKGNLEQIDDVLIIGVRI